MKSLESDFKSQIMTIKVTRVDYEGNTYGNPENATEEAEESVEEMNVAYLKCINVPSMMDIGCQETDPVHPQFELDILDLETYNIELDEFLKSKNKLKVEKIFKFKQALNAIHVTMRVCRVEIELKN